MATAKYDNRALTRKLRELAATIHNTRLIDGEAVQITKGDALAEEIFKSALGYIETVVVETDTPGKTEEKKIYRKPESWAKQFIWDRLEGKPPAALPDNKSGLSTADRVDELARDRINAATDALVQEKPYGEPPSLSVPETDQPD